MSKKIEDTFFCNICDKLYDNEYSMSVHIEGKPHKKQMKKLENKEINVIEINETEIIERIKVNIYIYT